MEVIIRVLLCLALVAKSTQKLTAEEMRKALNQDPMSSHPRWGQEIPQSVNLIVPKEIVESNIHFSPPGIRFKNTDTPIEVATSIQEAPPILFALESQPSVATQSGASSGTSIRAGKPAMIEQVIGQVATAPIIPPASSPDVPVVGSPPLVQKEPKVLAKEDVAKVVTTNARASHVKPSVFHAERKSVVKETNIIFANQPSKPIVNDRMANTLISQKPSNKIKQQETSVNTSPPLRGCPFQVTTFFLPDPEISQRDFEQVYLLPALRAYLLHNEICDTRPLTVYLDWLLHLRERLFNV